MISSSAAAKKVGSNQDLLLQIIICLPLKPVLRFKALSKTWLSLIIELHPRLLDRYGMSCEPVHGIFLRMTPIRAKNHYTPFSDGNMQDHMHQYIPLNPIKNRHVSTKYTQVKQLNLPKCPLGDNEIIVLSTKGLFLCYKLDSRRFYVYNPTTLSSYTTIPDHSLCYTIPKEKYSDPYPLGMVLAFDPVTSPHYKLIFVWRKGRYGSDVEIGVYSSETGTWSGSGGIIKAASNEMLTNGVYWNGSVHWISDYLDERSGRRYITRLQVDNMRIRGYAGPQERNKYIFKCKSYYFGETCGHLHYIESGINTVMDIYEMKPDYSEWFVKYKINLAKEINNSRYRDNPYSFDLISVIRFEDIEEKAGVLVLWVGNKVIKCNLVNRKFKTLAEFGNGYEPGPVRFKPKREYSDDLVYPAFGLENGFPFIPSLSDT